MAVDEARGIVYAPTGSAASDFYGANRAGDDLFAHTLLALTAETGARIWHFQGVHHNIWDRDFPAPPSLVTLTRNGRRIDAVAQATKHGRLFLFDRVTGRPLFPIEDRRVPESSVDDERTAATQPMPTRPAPFARQRLTADLLTTRTPEADRAALAAPSARSGATAVRAAERRRTDCNSARSTRQPASCCGRTCCLSGNATPSTREVGGRQFVVVPAGGGRDRPQPGRTGPPPLRLSRAGSTWRMLYRRTIGRGDDERHSQH